MDVFDVLDSRDADNDRRVIELGDEFNDNEQSLFYAIRKALKSKSRSKNKFKLPSVLIRRRPPKFCVKGNNTWQVSHQSSDYRADGLMDIDPDDESFQEFDWGTDSEDEGQKPDAIIDRVARANTVLNEQAQVLPEIRAAPCPIHSKRGDITQRAKHEDRSPRKQVGHKSEAAVHGGQKVVRGRGNTMDVSVRIPEQFPATLRQPMLPKNMTSKEYVMTWLIHGSEPNRANHFPDIITPRKTPHKVVKIPSMYEVDYS